MWQKAFHVILITSLVLFSAAMIVALVSGLTSLLFAFGGEHDGVLAYSGGVSVSLLKLIGLMVLLMTVLVVSLVASRRRLR